MGISAFPESEALSPYPLFSPAFMPRLPNVSAPPLGFDAFPYAQHRLPICENRNARRNDTGTGLKRVIPVLPRRQKRREFSELLPVYYKPSNSSSYHSVINTIPTGAQHEPVDSESHGGVSISCQQKPQERPSEAETDGAFSDSQNQQHFQGRAATRIQAVFRGWRVRKQKPMLGQLKKLNEICQKVQQERAEFDRWLQENGHACFRKSSARHHSPQFAAEVHLPKEILWFQEVLMKHLLEIDSIPSQGSDIVRRRRREAVLDVQRHLHYVDEIKSGLS